MHHASRVQNAVHFAQADFVALPRVIGENLRVSALHNWLACTVSATLEHAAHPQHVLPCAKLGLHAHFSFAQHCIPCWSLALGLSTALAGQDLPPVMLSHL